MDRRHSSRQIVMALNISQLTLMTVSTTSNLSESRIDTVERLIFRKLSHKQMLRSLEPLVHSSQRIFKIKMVTQFNGPKENGTHLTARNQSEASQSKSLQQLLASVSQRFKFMDFIHRSMATQLKQLLLSMVRLNTQVSTSPTEE